MSLDTIYCIYHTSYSDVVAVSWMVYKYKFILVDVLIDDFLHVFRQL